MKLYWRIRIFLKELIKRIKYEKINSNIKNKVYKIIIDSFCKVFRIDLPRGAINNLFDALSEVKETEIIYIRDLISFAEIDMNASEFLREKGIYSLSVYHLQQSVEKITKAFGLWSGFLSMDEIYGKKKRRAEKVEHISPRAFVLMLKNRISRQYAHILSNAKKYNDQLNYPDDIKEKKIKKILSTKNINSEIEKLERIIVKQKQLARISQEEINHFLDITVVYSKLYDNIDPHLLKRDLDLFGMSVKSKFEEESLPKELSDEIYSKITKINFNYILPYLDFPLFLYFLSIVTYPHFSYTRYPNNSNIKYDGTLGIVKSLPRILETLEQNLEKIKQMVK